MKLEELPPLDELSQKDTPIEEEFELWRKYEDVVEKAALNARAIVAARLDQLKASELKRAIEREILTVEGWLPSFDNDPASVSS